MTQSSRDQNPDKFEIVVQKYRAKFLDSVSVIDVDLTLILSDYFLRRDDDFPLWLDSIFDIDRWASFGQKIGWLGKILKHRFPDYEKRKELVNQLDEIRELRNQFAHQFSQETSEVESDEGKFTLYSLKDGKLVPVTIEADFFSEMAANVIFVNKELEKIKSLVLKDRKTNSKISGSSFESTL